MLMNDEYNNDSKDHILSSFFFYDDMMINQPY